MNRKIVIIAYLIFIILFFINWAQQHDFPEVKEPYLGQKPPGDSGLGDVDQSLKWLEEAYEGRDFRHSFVKVDPFFDNARSDPRFKALLNKIGLEK